MTIKLVHPEFFFFKNCFVKAFELMIRLEPEIFNKPRELRLKSVHIDELEGSVTAVICKLLQKPRPLIIIKHNETWPLHCILQ